MPRRDKDFYRGISFQPPAGAAQELSPSTIDRMVSYFARHAIDKRGRSWDAYGKGRQAWDGWDGDAGERWARSIARRMDAAERRAVG